jgi:hypothetical protein
MAPGRRSGAGAWPRGRKGKEGERERRRKGKEKKKGEKERRKGKREEGKEKEEKKRKGRKIKKKRKENRGRVFRKSWKIVREFRRKVFAGFFRFPDVDAIFGVAVMARRTGRRDRGVRGIPGRWPTAALVRRAWVLAWVRCRRDSRHARRGEREGRTVARV